MNENDIIKLMDENNISISDIIANRHEFAMKSVHTDRKLHIAIAIPINREITAESFTSLIQLYSHLSKNYEVSFSSSIATYLHEGRALILKNLEIIHKQKPIDYVIWVDSDMVYTAQDFEDMLNCSIRRDIAFLSGLYLTKRSIANKPVYMIFNGKDYKLAENYPKSNCLIEVDGVGFGFFLCRGKELFELAAKLGHKLFKLENDESNKMVGEDVVFSKAVVKAGYKLIVWTAIQLGHEGHIIKPKHFGACNKQEILDKIQWVKKEDLPLITISKGE